MEELEKFTLFIKEKRTALGISARELSKRVFENDSNDNYIAELERGARHGLTFGMAARILKELNSEIQYIEH